jgi:hypothetical protein
MRHFRALENKMLPHIVMFFQWSSLVLLIGFNLNFAVFVTGAVTQGSFKVIMVYNILVPFFSILLLPIFYRIRKKGTVEKFIASLSVVASVIGFSSICLNFVDDFVILMKSTELAAWSLYNIMLSLSMYKVLATLLMSIERWFERFNASDGDEISLAQGQK